MQRLSACNRKMILTALQQNNKLVTLAKTSPRAYSKIGHALLVFASNYNEREYYSTIDPNAYSLELKERLLDIASKGFNPIILEFLAMTHTLPPINIRNENHKTLLFSAAKITSENASSVLSEVIELSYENSLYCQFEGDRIDRQNQDGNTVLHLAVIAGNKALIKHLFDNYNPNVRIRNNIGALAIDLSTDFEIKNLFAEYNPRSWHLRLRQCCGLR